MRVQTFLRTCVSKRCLKSPWRAFPLFNCPPKTKRNQHPRRPVSQLRCLSNGLLAVLVCCVGFHWVSQLNASCPNHTTPQSGIHLKNLHTIIHLLQRYNYTRCDCSDYMSKKSRYYSSDPWYTGPVASCGVGCYCPTYCEEPWIGESSTMICEDVPQFETNCYAFFTCVETSYLQDDSCVVGEMGYMSLFTCSTQDSCEDLFAQDIASWGGENSTLTVSLVYDEPWGEGGPELLFTDAGSFYTLGYIFLLSSGITFGFVWGVSWCIKRIKNS
jgi:hypothetical protein